MASTATRVPIRVLVTRPVVQAETWVNDMIARGVDAVALPLIEIVPAVDKAALTGAWAQLEVYKLVMFVSPNAAAHFFGSASRGVWPQKVLAASPGPGTSASLQALGVERRCIMEPGVDSLQFDSEALWQRLEHLDWRGARVLVVSGQGGRDWLAQRLQHAGAEVDFLSVYLRAPPQWTPRLLELAGQALNSPLHHLWFFSSSEAVQQLLQRFPRPSWMHSRALVTHPRIAQAAEEAGFSEVSTSRADFESVLACIQSLGIPGGSGHLFSLPLTRPQ
jgi:uroporphyrinogen-III synthase